MTDRQGPCLVVDHEAFGPEFPCQLRLDHVGKHHNGDDDLSIQWLPPEYGPAKPSVLIPMGPYGPYGLVPH